MHSSLILSNTSTSERVCKYTFYITDGKPYLRNLNVMVDDIS